MLHLFVIIDLSVFDCWCSPEAQKKFLEITSAYEVLGDDRKRSEYDFSLEEGQHRRSSRRQQSHPFQNGHPFQHHFHEMNHENVFMHRTADGRIFFSMGGAHNFDNHFNYQERRPSLGLLIFQILYSMFAPMIPFVLFVLAIIIVICAGDSKPKRRTPINKHQASPQQQPPSDKSRALTKRKLPQLHSTFEMKRNIVYVLATNEVTEDFLLTVKSKFATDPLCFMTASQEVPINSDGNKANVSDDTNMDGTQSNRILAISRGGERFCEISFESSNQLEGWLCKIINGEAKWLNSHEHVLPIKLK